MESGPMQCDNQLLFEELWPRLHHSQRVCKRLWRNHAVAAKPIMAPITRNARIRPYACDKKLKYWLSKLWSPTENWFLISSRNMAFLP